MRVLGEIEGVVGTPKRALEVAQKGIDRSELRQPDAGPASARDNALVLGAHDLDGAEAPQPVGDHRSRGRDRARCEDRQCAACRYQCSVISGTIFEATKLPLSLSRWFLAIHLLTQSKNNVVALELMRHLGVCYKTAWLMKHKLMEVMREREDTRQLEGRVEIDDAYLGGERTGGKVGRGSENKVPFVAAVQTMPDGQLQFVCLRQQPFTIEEVEVQPAFAPKRATVAASARRTDKALGPARFDQRHLATVVTAVPVHEFGHRKPRLKLHSVHRHGSPPVSVNPSSTPQWLTA
jgi:hypothetical protein